MVDHLKLITATRILRRLMSCPSIKYNFKSLLASASSFSSSSSSFPSCPISHPRPHHRSSFSFLVELVLHHHLPLPPPQAFASSSFSSSFSLPSHPPQASRSPSLLWPL